MKQVTTCLLFLAGRLIPAAAQVQCATQHDNLDRYCGYLLQSVPKNECDCYDFCDGELVGCIEGGVESSAACDGAMVYGCSENQRLNDNGADKEDAAPEETIAPVPPTETTPTESDTETEEIPPATTAPETTEVSGTGEISSMDDTDPDMDDAGSILPENATEIDIDTVEHTVRLAALTEVYNNTGCRIQWNNTPENCDPLLKPHRSFVVCDCYNFCGERLIDCQNFDGAGGWGFVCPDSLQPMVWGCHAGPKSESQFNIEEPWLD